MSDKPENPKAFATLRVHNGMVELTSQMTLRDYFAAKAMQALIMEPEKHTVKNAKQCACVAYDIADTMLATRGL